MSDIRTLTKKQLSKQLVDKHQRLIEEYGKEFDRLHKLLVLKEKQELLEHWVADAEREDDAKKAKEYAKQKKSNDKEMERIKEELKEINPASDPESKQRYNSLKQRVDSHKAAMNYWNTKVQNE